MSNKTVTTTKTPMLIGASKRQTKIDHQMDYVLQKYLERHPDNDGSIDPANVCRWAEEQGIFSPAPPITPQEKFRRQFSKHLGQRFVTDRKNREVRALHAVPYEYEDADGTKQRGFRYHALYTTPPDQIWLSLGGRRTGVARRVFQIDTDWQSYNDFNIFGATLPQMNFDFNTTLKEKAMPETYPDEAPEGHDADDDDPT